MRSDIQYYLPMKDGVTPQLFFRIHPIKYNDGSIEDTLQYLSTCGGGWMNSMNKNKEELISRLVRV